MQVHARDEQQPQEQQQQQQDDEDAESSLTALWAIHAASIAAGILPLSSQDARLGLGASQALVCNCNTLQSIFAVFVLVLGVLDVVF